jgi:hypothetical protein
LTLGNKCHSYSMWKTELISEVSLPWKRGGPGNRRSGGLSQPLLQLWTTQVLHLQVGLGHPLLLVDLALPLCPGERKEKFEDQIQDFPIVASCTLYLCFSTSPSVQATRLYPTLQCSSSTPISNRTSRPLMFLVCLGPGEVV